MSPLTPVMTHPWNLELDRARELQKFLSLQVVEHSQLPEKFRLIAGADAAYDDEPEGGTVTALSEQRLMVYAAVVVLSAQTGEIVAISEVRREAEFPYVPGFLSFREVPALIEAFYKLDEPPDLIFCDGQGRAHPRRFGLACHLGVLLDIPTIGCAKSRLLGLHEEPGPQRGSASPLMDGDEVIGEVVRTRTNVRPVYVSIGHKVSLSTARQLTVAHATRYRLPEPIRAADTHVNEMKRKYSTP